MAIIAQEEMSHFEMVHNIMLEKDMVMGRERKDQYVLDLHQFFPKGGRRSDQIVHKLLCAALIRQEVVSDSAYYLNHYQINR